MFKFGNSFAKKLVSKYSKASKHRLTIALLGVFIGVLALFFQVSYWISICRHIGGQIDKSKPTYHTSASTKTPAKAQGHFSSFSLSS